MILLQQNLDRYLNDKAFLRLLGEHGICFPSDFVNNAEGIDDVENPAAVTSP